MITKQKSPKSREEAGPKSDTLVIDQRRPGHRMKKATVPKDAESRNAEVDKLDRVAKKLVTKGVVRSTEAGFKNEYNRMLRYNSLLIRRMNQALETNLTSRDIYALSTLMSQQREVINDLRAITDLSGQVEMINQQSITPFVSDLTQLITDVYYQLRKLIMETAKPKETQFALSQLDDLIKQVGLGLQTNHTMMRQSIESILIGAPQNTVKSKKRSRGA